MDKKSILLTVITFCILLFIGLNTQIYVGDETYHFRLAKVIYETGKRPISDPVYKDFPKLGYFHLDAILWHILLTCFWKITGGISKYAAQIYQLIYFLLLVLSTYFLTKEIYGKKESFFSILLLITSPITILFSILLYIDVPLTALVTLCFLLLFKNKHFFAGITLGFTILMKINALFLIPAIVLLIFIYPRKDNFIKSKFINLLKVGLPCILINMPDIYFRYENFGEIYYSKPRVLANMTVSYYSPSSLLNNPLFLVQYLGLPLLILTILYFIFRQYEKKDNFLWLIIIPYIIFWLIFFKYTLDVRYLIAIVPFLSIMAAKAISSLKNKWIIRIFILMCLLQFIFVLSFTYFKRQIPQGIKEGYDFVNKNVSKNAVLMYPGEDIVTYTGRPIAYGRIWKIAEMYWAKNDIVIYNLLKEYLVDYVIIKKERSYDDSKAHHISGYPASFVKKLPQLNFLKNVFDNKELSIWKVIK